MCSEEAGAQEQTEPRREAGRRDSPLSRHRGRPLGLPGQAEHTRWAIGLILSTLHIIDKVLIVRYSVILKNKFIAHKGCMVYF